MGSVDDKEDVSNTEEPTRGFIPLLAGFSGKYYRRRSLEKRKQNKNIKTIEKDLLIVLHFNISFIRNLHIVFT